MFKTIDDIKNFQRKLRPSNDTFIYYYLNMIYQNLLIREESPNADINEFNNKNLFANTQKQKANEKGIVSEIFYNILIFKNLCVTEYLIILINQKQENYQKMNL